VLRQLNREAESLDASVIRTRGESTGGKGTALTVPPSSFEIVIPSVRSRACAVRTAKNLQFLAFPAACAAVPKTKSVIAEIDLAQTEIRAQDGSEVRQPRRSMLKLAPSKDGFNRPFGTNTSIMLPFLNGEAKVRQVLLIRGNAVQRED
jgi:hypothetical protein